MSLDRITLAARTSWLAALLGLALVTGNQIAVQSVLLVAAIAVTAGVATAASRIPGEVIAGVEALLVGGVVALAVPESTLLVPYLIVPALVAGLYRGAWAVVVVVVAELTAVVSILLLGASVEGVGDANLVSTWLLTSLATGLLGSAIRRVARTAAPVEAAYQDAKALLTQLHALSRRLSAGLDSTDMAVRLADLATEELGATQALVVVRDESGTLTPLHYTSGADRERFWVTDGVVGEALGHKSAVRTTAQGLYRTVLPLHVGDRPVGSVVADSPADPGEERVAQLAAGLDAQAVQLDTALLFDEVRSVATVQERQRLAREVHDGIAQDLASLGYLIDDAAATPTSLEQGRRLRELRDELTRVVGELRLSIFDLRSEVSAGAGLGAALSDYLHRVGSRASMAVHLSLDEAPSRLRPEVEVELLRIAQEAITNVRRHSGAANLWVDCRVRPPFARIQVRDDGIGTDGGQKADSYGLRIMRERAQRIDASLQISRGHADRSRSGTVVTVQVGSDVPGSDMPGSDRAPQTEREGGHLAWITDVSEDGPARR